MLSTDLPIIVEGKYDKITLENVIDAPIIVANGFSLFKDKEKCELIRNIAKSRGIIVMTDSDNAGSVIRSRIKQICAGGRVINIYAPQICGKEKRKSSYSKQGLLGVEGLSPEILKDTLERGGAAVFEGRERRSRIDKTELFSLGLSGGEGSAQKRASLQKFLSLPDSLSANAFLDAVNILYSLEEFREQVELWQQEQDKK